MHAGVTRPIAKRQPQIAIPTVLFPHPGRSPEVVPVNGAEDLHLGTSHFHTDHRRGTTITVTS